MARCLLHLPGNAECPYTALYEVIWTPHRITPVGKLTRPVCVQHLAPAIDQALDDSARGATIEVRLAQK